MTTKTADVKKTSQPQTDNTAPVAKVEKTQTKLNDILHPTAKSRIKKLETLNVLAQKHSQISAKYDDLTKFMAGNDNTAQMKFTAENGYSFSVKNPEIINKILLIVEGQLSNLLADVENEVLKFHI